MQKLQFEPSWDKTLSPKDRKIIEGIFLETRLSNHANIELTPLRQAINHKGELLVTVLVHNFSQRVLLFHNKKLRYIENEKIIAEHIFTLPPLVIQQETSMPWTFIFPIESLKNPATLAKGQLEFVD
ncbi:SLAP domain-containing protein [Peribacillus asahii]|uniref:SLAP domain-containing protein n=1 Tax=Peribacillus asahii TaxID=228899 RepID=A0A398AYU3_9BACI|nr:SLAP domain-containing protein [Peribacillus asahii]RID82214.1 SLAP domain-containing protein [Peribacillus asahii]